MIRIWKEHDERMSTLYNTSEKMGRFCFVTPIKKGMKMTDPTEGISTLM
jgi:hypothetical protein